MNKKYIDKEEWIGRLEEELSTCKNEKRKEYLTIWINAIKCQPTLDEKKIIRKAFERVVERLKKKIQASDTKFDNIIEMNAYDDGVDDAIEIVKEEGGIE